MVTPCARRENTGRRAGWGDESEGYRLGHVGSEAGGKAATLPGCVDSESPAGQSSLCLHAPCPKALRASRVGEGEQCPRATMSKGY